MRPSRKADQPEFNGSGSLHPQITQMDTDSIASSQFARRSRRLTQMIHHRAEAPRGSEAGMKGPLTLVPGTEFISICRVGLAPPSEP